MNSRIFTRRTVALGWLLLGMNMFLFAQKPLKKPLTMAKHSSKVDYTLTPAAAEKMGLGEKEVRRTGIHSNHVWVDLGLSVKWADCNVGAQTAEEDGACYAWGETETKDNYSPENSKTWKKRFHAINGKAEYDPARLHWKGKWRMPTDAEVSELIFDCEWKLDTIGQQTGYRVVGKTGQSIFLPLAGCRDAQEKEPSEDIGCYWSASPHKKNNSEAFSLFLHRQRYSFEWGNRYSGRRIRPVMP